MVVGCCDYCIVIISPTLGLEISNHHMHATLDFLNKSETRKSSEYLHCCTGEDAASNVILSCDAKLQSQCVNGQVVPSHAAVLTSAPQLSITIS